MKTSNETAAAAGGGAGAGLVPMAAAMAAAGVAVNPARRAMGAESQSIGQLLRGCERPAGPLLQAIQAAQDLAMCEGFARRLNKKMVGEGRESCLVRNADGGFEWVPTMRDAIGAAAAAVACWRAGYSITRDASGGDALTVGDEFGNVGALWIKTTFPPVRVKKGESASEAVARVQAAESVSEVVAGYCGGRRVAFVKRQVKDMAAFIAWRALVDSVTDDNLGESASVQAAAADFYAWAAMANNIGDMSRLIFEGLTVEHRNASVVCHN